NPYPEYTGTLTQELLPGSDAGLRQRVEERGVVLSRSLGFSDSYAIGMKRVVAERLKIRTIEDLARHPELKLGFSHEFMDRNDGPSEAPARPRGARRGGLLAADARRQGRRAQRRSGEPHRGADGRASPARRSLAGRGADRRRASRDRGRSAASRRPGCARLRRARTDDPLPRPARLHDPAA